MKLGDFVDRLSYSDKTVIQLFLYADGFANPIAIVQPDWEGVKPYADYNISSIRVEDCNGWSLELKIILITPIFGQAFNPD